MEQPTRVDRLLLVLILGVTLADLSGCFAVRSSSGGGQTTFTPPRHLDAHDIGLPHGYRIDALAAGLTFPSGVAFDDTGGIYVVETGYSYGEVSTTPRLLRVDSEGHVSAIATGGRNGPWNGVTYHQGAFYIAEGGEFEGGRILRITPEGNVTPLVEGLPSFGDHHTNGPVVGPDGRLYFGQGTATNSGVVGEDSGKFGWLKRHPDFHDIPCRDVTLNGANFTTPNVLAAGPDARIETGAFSPFGAKTNEGQVVAGRVPCSGAVMRIALEGGAPELVAWGFRNPFGLAFAPDGRLFVTDNSYDVRGSRPVHGTGDLLWAVTPGVWYGWPDFHGNNPLDMGDHYVAPGKPRPKLLMATHPGRPPKPAAVLGVHSSSNTFDFSRSAKFGHVGQAFVPQFGDMAPDVGKVLAPVGFKVIRVDVTTGVVEDFAANRAPANGPASFLRKGGLERPIAARFDPSGAGLYVVDFGVMTMGRKGPEPRARTGVLWKITREE